MSAIPQIAFGTSGLRGPVEAFTPERVYAYVRGFLETLCAGASEKALLVGQDLRASSPEIAKQIFAAARAAGWQPYDAGQVPTPALAAYGIAHGLPAIMVTGSHIPADMNGMKFYRPEGEMLKVDEPVLGSAAKAYLKTPGVRDDEAIADILPAVAEAYLARYIDAFSSSLLSGLRVGLYQHSAVGRDMLETVLSRLGAQCIAFGRSATFVPVDTEAVSPTDLDLMRARIAQDGLDAVVSTDGDSDRPLLLDANGRQINGDILGLLTAHWLEADSVVTPLTSTGAIERVGWFKTVVRCRVGSPYVVETMAEASGRVAGFEANGGFLLGTDIAGTNGNLGRLPTRDAVLPLLAILAQAAAQKRPVSDLVDDLPPRVMRADRLKNIAPELGNGLVAEMATTPETLDPRLAGPVAVDTLDGTRLSLKGGDVVHFRQSGNAPELRCYVETDSAPATEALLGDMMAALSKRLG